MCTRTDQHKEWEESPYQGVSIVSGKKRKKSKKPDASPVITQIDAKRVTLARWFVPAGGNSSTGTES